MSANSIKLARRKTLPHPHDTPYSRKACSEMIEQYLEASIVFPSACEQFEDLKTEFLQRKEAAGGNSLFVGMDSREAPAARGNGCLRPAQIERRFTTSKWIRIVDLTEHYRKAVQHTNRTGVVRYGRPLQLHSPGAWVKK
eukprot:scaffold3953_cov169-Amphora_coffeaeformis.AAC.2